MDPLPDLPTTQPSVPHQSILVNAQGNPLKINLQAVELEGRPKLVRALKSAGALVASNAKEAAIILVDSATESGKRLIRTWGHDASKVVLEHTWARTSVDAGRPLLEADNWGGSMTIDDGKPVTIDGVVVDEDELDEVEALVTKSPLPTPRVTPVDPTTQLPENTVTEQSDITRSETNSTLVPHVTGTPPAAPPIAHVAVTFAGEPMADSNHDVQPLKSPPPATQPLSYAHPNLFTQSSQPQNAYSCVPYGTQHPYPSSQLQMMPAQPFPHAGFPSSQSQVVHLPSVPHTPLPSVQSKMTQMMPNTQSLNFQAPDFVTLMTIMEVVRHFDQSSRFGQNPLPVSQSPAHVSTPALSVQRGSAPGPTSSTSTFQATRGSEPPGVDTYISSSQERVSGTAISSRKREAAAEFSESRSVARKHRKHARRSPDETSTPSISRKRPPAVKPTNPPPKRLRKGKEKVIFTDSSDHSEVDELMDASDDSYSTHSIASSPSQSIIARGKQGEIFLSRAGQPLRFFVQVDLHGRHTVVTNIKKNKGKIVNNIADADYLILFARSDTFQGLLSEATALGKSPILAAFVADCIEEGALLDETDYILESATKVKALRRGRQNAFSIKVETPVSLSPHTKVAKPESSSIKKEDKRSKGTPTKSSIDKRSRRVAKSASKCTAESEESSMASCPPTPPPASTRQLMKSGKYLFTEVEDEYFLCLAKHYLTRDPTISNTALIHKLHEQLPHHSTASWTAHIDKKLKGAVEEIRKRANIAKRKRVKEAANNNVFQGPENDGMICEGHITRTAHGNDDVPSNPSKRSQEDWEREDFEVITHFFASGGGDDDDDERVWQELEKHRQCRSATSWPEYYAANEKQVYARIEELMNERAKD